MDRKMLEQHLVLARQHVKAGARHIARQREIVEELNNGRHDDLTAEARRLLHQFEELQAQHIADRDRIIRELTAPAED